MLYGTIANREELIKKTFIVKVAYPAWMENPSSKITPMLIYNEICKGTNYIECDVEEINNAD